MNETWRLINNVRDGGDFLTLPEKQRLHDAVVRLKSCGKISADDLKWLQSMANQLAGVAEMQKTFRRRGRSS